MSMVVTAAAAAVGFGFYVHRATCFWGLNLIVPILHHIIHCTISRSHYSSLIRQVREVVMNYKSV